MGRFGSPVKLEDLIMWHLWEPITWYIPNWATVPKCRSIVLNDMGFAQLIVWDKRVDYVESNQNNQCVDSTTGSANVTLQIKSGLELGSLNIAVYLQVFTIGFVFFCDQPLFLNNQWICLCCRMTRMFMCRYMFILQSKRVTGKNV